MAAFAWTHLGRLLLRLFAFARVVTGSSLVSPNGRFCLPLYDGYPGSVSEVLNFICGLVSDVPRTLFRKAL